MPKEQEFMKVGRGYLVVIIGLLCATALAITVMIQSPQSTHFMADFWKDIFYACVAAIAAKEAGKIAQAKLTK